MQISGPRPFHSLRRAPRALFVVTGILTSSLLAIPTLAGASTASNTTLRSPLPSAKSLVAAMNKAMSKMRSVHLEITASQTSPKVKETISQNSGLAYGTQYVTTGNEHANVILTKANAYLSGNNSGLSAFFALPPDDLPLVASKWIVIKAGATQYTTFVNTISISHLLKNLVPSSTPTSVRAITYHSRLAYELAWTVKTSTTTTKLTLVLPRTGQLLPIAETAVAGSTTEQSVLSKWNQSFAIKVPKNTIAITKLHSS